MTSLQVAVSTEHYLDAIQAASTLGPSWFWCGGIELFSGAQDVAYLECLKWSKTSGKRCASGSFCSSTAANMHPFDIKF
jgi:hypothetical protein